MEEPMRYSRPVQVMSTAVIVAGASFGGVALFAPAGASAVPTIPAAQKACASPKLTLSGGTGPYHSLGIAVTVNDGTIARHVVTFVSMDANVSQGAEMRLSWKIDTQPVTDYKYGPGNIAENQQFDGTRTIMNVIRLGPGRHRLRPQVRLSGNPSTSGIVDRLCVVAEVSSG
jgi:hypothetical protein